MRPGLKPFYPEQPWKNCHENFTNRFTPGASWRPDHLESQGLSDSQRYHRATQNLQWVIKNALEQGNTIRAIGANWSFSEVAMCDGGMVQTKGLDLIFNLNAGHINPAYTGTGRSHNDLKLVECGVQIARLNRFLEIESDPPRSLKASGGSNGQTIAGATATGTHGAALFTGAVHDSIAGIHLITGPDTHVWLERASYPVASDEFISWLGAEPVRDDDLFHAAVVSFGSFGIIHSVMIETEPLYLLKEYRMENILYSEELLRAFELPDIDKLRELMPEMPESIPGHELYHMEINMNPYEVKKGKKGGFYAFMFYKLPVPPGHVVNHGGIYDPAPSPELIWMMKNLPGVLGNDLSYNHIRKATTREFEKNIRPATPEPKSIGAIFRDTRFTGNIASFALAVDTASLGAALDQILEEISVRAFAGALAVRFVKGTKAILGFTRFAHTCVIELDGLDNEANHQVFANVIRRLEDNDIPNTIHWGKLNRPLTEERLRKMYGRQRLDSWRLARQQLLKPEVRAVFTNPFMKNLGLDKPLGVIV